MGHNCFSSYRNKCFRDRNRDTKKEHKRKINVLPLPQNVRELIRVRETDIDRQSEVKRGITRLGPMGEGEFAPFQM